MANKRKCLKKRKAYGEYVCLLSANSRTRVVVRGYSHCFSHYYCRLLFFFAILSIFPIGHSHWITIDDNDNDYSYNIFFLICLVIDLQFAVSVLLQLVVVFI